MAAVAPPIRIATRKSLLAQTQAAAYGTILAGAAGRDFELVLVTTQGDVTSGSLANFGGVGVFVGAVREAVLTGQADIGVHSLKDVPTYPHPGLTLLACPQREDPRDVLCARAGMDIASLPTGATVGSGSLRRAAQLRALRPDLSIVDIRGNVDSRLAKVDRGELDAIVLAAAGLARLGQLDRVTQYLPMDVMLPAPGQGSLAVEAREDLVRRDPDLHKSVVSTDNERTRAAVTSERAVLNQLEAGCSAPVGAIAHVDAAVLELAAVVASIDGTQIVRMSTSGPASDADHLGRQLATEMLDAGAAGLMGVPGDQHEGTQDESSRRS